MIYLTVLATGQEWAKLRDAAYRLFPTSFDRGARLQEGLRWRG
jgi:hypothetical protein